MTGVANQAVCNKEPGHRTIIDTNDRHPRKRTYEEVRVSGHELIRKDGEPAQQRLNLGNVFETSVPQSTNATPDSVQSARENPSSESLPAILSETEEIARRRRLRAQILAKYSTDTKTKDGCDLSRRLPTDESTFSTPVSSPRSEAQLQLTKETSELHPSVVDDEGPAAADYDPDFDRIVEHEAHRRPTGSNDSTKLTNMISGPLPDVEEDDMFADPRDVTPIMNPSTESRFLNNAQKLDETTLDSWADTEGYYRIMIGELLDGRFAVQSTLGKGVFSAVVRAIDQHDGSSVAIKVIRNNDIMRKAGMKEINILETLMAADPDDRKHIVRLKSTFDHRGHLCLVFESLSLNLREVLKKFGRDVGINLKAVRAYAQQIFLGLSLMRKCNIMHADLKPDNILVSESRTLLKICDLGSASDISENDLTPYLASRFYRAPEVILGLPYDASMDIWAIGCTLYEMYTGKILFPGRSNNQMLRLFMECRGRIPPKLLKKAAFCATHFDDQYNFNSVEFDKITGEDTLRVLNISKPTKDFKLRLLLNATSEERGLLVKFVDLLEKCTDLDASKRITPNEALKHPFLARN